MYVVPDDEKMTARVGVRLTESEHNRLSVEAASHGLTLSNLIRSKAVGAKITSRIDAQAIAELRRQGGLLKHLAQTTGIDKSAVAAALDDIRRTIMAIAK